MRYLLDTGIAQDLISRNARVVRRVDDARRAGNRIGICAPVLGELWSGVEGSISRDRNSHRLRLALSRLVVWPYTNEAAEQFGRVRRTSPHREAHAADRHHGRGDCVRARRLHSRIQGHGSRCDSWVKGRELGRKLNPPTSGRVFVMCGLIPLPMAPSSNKIQSRRNCGCSRTG